MKRYFLQEPHGVTSKKTAFFIVTRLKPRILENSDAKTAKRICSRRLDFVLGRANEGFRVIERDPVLAVRFLSNVRIPSVGALGVSL
jgi:hypothetical protein